jgi:hypothetical protein
MATSRSLKATGNKLIQSFFNFSLVSAAANARFIDCVIRYIPSQWADKKQALPPIGRLEVNALNSRLVEQLQSEDSAFSAGISADGLVCVRFGLITADTQLGELVEHVCIQGRDLEQNTKVCL